MFALNTKLEHTQLIKMAKKIEFKINDCVRLSSNPQQMTIEKINRGSAYCVWIFKGKKCGADFELKTLVHCGKSTGLGGAIMA